MTFEDLSDEDAQNMLSLIRSRHNDRKKKFDVYLSVSDVRSQFVLDTEFLLRYIENLENKLK